MSKRFVPPLVVLTVLTALPALAQEHGEAAATMSGGMKWGALAAAFTIGLAAFGGALGQGKAIVAACDAMGRNPGAAGAVRLMALIGLAFIESLVIYALIIAFAVVNK